jgi:hypothetical protein
MPSPPSALRNFQQDPPLVQNAQYRLNGPDRQYIDDQIQAIQVFLLQGMLAGVLASYFVVDATSGTISPGDVLCSAPSTIGIPTVTRATTATTANSPSIVGIAITAASPGGRVFVAMNGILPPSLTGLSGGVGVVRVNLSTARCQSTSSYSLGDVPVGTVDAAGYLTLTRTAINTVPNVLTEAFVVDSASAAVSIGDTICVTLTGTVTRATAIALGVAGAVLGVAINAASPGGVVFVREDGLLSPTITGLSTFGPVRANTTTGRLQQVSSYSTGDYPMGNSTATGWLTMVRGIVIGSATGYVPPAGNVLWLDATNGAAPNLWGDRSAAGNNFIQNTTANQPTIITSGINGLQTVQMTAANSQFYTGPSFGALTAGSIYMIVQSNGASGAVNGCWAWGEDSAGQEDYFAFGTTYIRSDFGSTTMHTINFPLTIAPTTAQLLTMISTSTEWTAIQGAASPSTIFTTATNTVSFADNSAGHPVQLGKSKNNTYGSIEFGEILMFNHKLSSTDDLSVRNYLKGRWNVA